MSSKRTKYTKHSRMPKLTKRQLYGIIAVAVIVVSLLAIYAFYSQPATGFQAIIVDQLSRTWENYAFAKNANSTLMAAGYGVEYYNDSLINVDFYRNLPRHGYKIVLLRVHSALRLNAEWGNLTDPLDLFTNEPYNNYTHVDDQMQFERLDIAMYSESSSERYFGVLPNFVAHSMLGYFQDAVVILMGCNGLDKYARSSSMLQALVGKGAKVCIGWDESVSGPHTDAATLKLLHNLLIENMTIKNGVNATMNDPQVGFSPKLKYYPNSPDVADYRIPHGPSKLDTAGASSEYVLFGLTGISALPLSLFSGRVYAFRRTLSRARL